MDKKTNNRPSPIDVEYVARLARLTLSEEEKTIYSAQLNEVLDFFEKLKKVDVEGVEPSAHPYDLSNGWRDDVPRPGFSTNEALANAPARRADQVVVPKVLEDA